jgi:CRP-like cAMP-binding protein
LLGAGVAKDLSPGDVLLRLGMPDGRWWLVRSGLLLAETTSSAGKRSIIEFLRPGDVIAGPEGPPDTCQIRSLTSCRLQWWPAGVVPDLVRKDAAVAEWLHDRLSARLHRAHRSLARSLGLSVSERLEDVLAELASLQGHPVRDGVRIDVSIDQETLAAAVGATRETVNRALRTLQSKGRIRRSDGRYTLFNPSARTDSSLAPREPPFLHAPASAGGPGPIAPRPDTARSGTPGR